MLVVVRALAVVETVVVAEFDALLWKAFVGLPRGAWNQCLVSLGTEAVGVARLAKDTVALLNAVTDVVRVIRQDTDVTSATWKKQTIIIKIVIIMIMVIIITIMTIK